MKWLDLNDVFREELQEKRKLVGRPKGRLEPIEVMGVNALVELLARRQKEGKRNP